MTLPDGGLHSTLAATWPAEELRRVGNLTLRRSAGGGKRVSAATVRGDTLSERELRIAEETMRGWGQTPLFTIRPEQRATDQTLESTGYRVVDRTVFYMIDVSKLASIPAPPVTCYDIWRPLAIMNEIWAEAGIGGDRLAVMERAATPKTALLGRQNDQPAGVGFVAAVDRVAMIHALEIRKSQRRQGLASALMGHAARWAQTQGCVSLALAVTEANETGRAFYKALGMNEAGGYHYRIAPAEVIR